MPKQNMKAFATEQGLISGQISRKILDKIRERENYTDEIAQYGISSEEFQGLKQRYQHQIENCQVLIKHPRYFHFYKILKDKFPEISWEIKNEFNDKPVINFSMPLIEKLQPSLLSFLFDRVVVINRSKLIDRYEVLGKLNPDVLRHIEIFFNSVQVLYPNQIQMDRFVQWVMEARKQVPSTIFIMTCPDYSVEPTNDPARPYKHTFKYLGDGIGQIARRIINIIPDLKKLFISLNISPRIVCAIADYEAYTDSNLTKLKVTKSEFLSRVDVSRKKFEKSCKSILKIDAIMFSKLCNGEEKWKEKIEEIKYYLQAKDYGLTGLNGNVMLKIVQNRKALYENWFGKKDSELDYIPIALSQAAEYTAIGYYITKKFNNCLFLGADSESFGPFYSYYKPVAALYLKRFYC